MLWIWITAAAILLLALLVFELLWARKLRQRERFMVMQEKRRKAEERVTWDTGEAQQVALLKKRVEVSFLQDQINPHFLYNTLDSIRSRALMSDQREIADMTQILSRFFRYCISRDEKLVRVEEELGHIRDYYYIQKFRFEDRFEMDMRLETDEINDLFLPRMTIQPLVENAMQHGLEKVEHTGLITIDLRRADEELVITVSDNGCGMSEAALEQLNGRLRQGYLNASAPKNGHTGIALHNVNARLKIMFGEQYGLRYRSLEGEGTDAVIRIPAVDVFGRARYEELLSPE